MFNLKRKVISLGTVATLAATTIMVPTGTPVYAKEKPVEVKEVSLDDWTIGLYLCGSNLESDGSSASGDIIEILESEVPDKFNEDVNIIIQTGGSKEWHFKETYGEILADKGFSEAEIDQIIPEEIDANKIQEYKVNFKHEYKDDKGKTKTVPTIEFIRDVAEYEEGDTEVCMGNQKYLESLLKDMHKDYPAEHNILDLWNHGGGITVGVCKDENTPDDCLTLRELLAALDTTDTKGDNKLDIIGYDACLMSNYESWNKLSAYADYGVGSLTSEPVDGWYYTPVIEELGKSYTEDDFTAKKLSECIVDAYEDYYKKGGVYDQNNAPEEETEDLGILDEDDLEEDEEMDDDAEAMLCAVNLRALNNSIPVFGELSDSLLKLYADKDGFEALREKFAEKSFAYGSFMWNSHIIGINDFLDAIDEVAETRIEEIADSTTVYDPIYKGLYENELKQTKALREAINSSFVKAYNGYEGNAYENSGAMSLFFPDYLKVRDKMAYFTVDEYAEYAVDSRYALYTYYAYNECKNFNVEDYESVFAYDAQSEEFTVSVPSEAATSAGITYGKVLEKNGKYYIAGSKALLPEDETCGIIRGSLDDIHFEIDGMIVQCTEANDTYVVIGKYNGENARFTFNYDEEKGNYNLIAVVTDAGDIIINFNEGDVITFVGSEYDSMDEDVINNVYPTSVTKDYVLKANDDYEDEEGMQVFSLPIETVKDQGNVGVLLINMHNQMGYSWGIVPEDFVTTEVKYVNYSILKEFANSKITIAQDVFELTGEKIEPKVLFDGKTNKYVEGKDYEVVYEDNIGLGKAKVTVRGIGDYELFGEKVIEFNIVKAKVVTVEGKEKVVYKTIVVNTPNKAYVKSVKNAKKKSLKVSWKKVKGVAGYEVVIARNKKFTKGKKVKNVKKTSLTFKKLKKNKTYFVKVRAYKLDPNGKKVYGDWSKVKKIKVRK